MSPMFRYMAVMAVLLLPFSGWSWEDASLKVRSYGLSALDLRHLRTGYCFYVWDFDTFSLLLGKMLIFRLTYFLLFSFPFLNNMPFSFLVLWCFGRCQLCSPPRGGRREKPRVSRRRSQTLLKKKGASELCSILDEKKIRRGLITRNVKEAVDIFHNRFGLNFLPALSREFRPYKPDPAPLNFICSAWGVQPSEVIMIGDSLNDDVACAKRAGAYACLLDETGRYNSLEYANVELKPDFTVSSLAQIHSLLGANFDLIP